MAMSYEGLGTKNDCAGDDKQHFTLPTKEPQKEVPWINSCWFLAWLTLRTGRWRQYVPSKHQLSLTRLHGVGSQKIWLFLTTAVRTADQHSLLTLLHDCSLVMPLYVLEQVAALSTLLFQWVDRRPACRTDVTTKFSYFRTTSWHLFLFFYNSCSLCV
jgi:hypothetical protein